MQEEIEKILKILEEIKEDIREIKEHQKSSSSKEKNTKTEIRKVFSPPSTTNYIEVQEKSDWDSCSIGELIE